MPQPPPPPPPDPSAAGVTFDSFSGLKNTVSPEKLTARELSRARNIDLDDLGQPHRRRGRRRILPGRWHSLFTTIGGRTFGVQDGVLVTLDRAYTVTALMPGVSDLPLAYEEIGDTLYLTSLTNSAKVDLATLRVKPWGIVADHAYQPGLEPGPADFWWSPVVNPDLNPETALPPGKGKLLGAPPLASAICSFNGRIYLAQGPVLWGTELFLYDYVDKTRGFRQFEGPITGLIAVDDGIYVGTTQALYFLSGAFGEHTRKMVEASGVVPGSMVAVPGELVDPEGRRFPDLPRQNGLGMACLTEGGVVAGLSGGNTYNLTRTTFLFPPGKRAPALFRQEDGVNSLVLPIRTGGPTTETARIGDYLSAEIIKATPGQPGSPSQPVGGPPRGDPELPPPVKRA